MKTISDYLNSGGIFGVVAEVSGAEVFNTFKPEELDAVLMFKFGDRLLVNKMFVDGEKCLKAYAFYMKEKFEFLNHLSGVEFNPITGNERVLEEVINKEDSSKYKGNETSKISAYDDDELVADGGRESDNIEDKKGEVKRTLKDSNNSMGNAVKNLQSLDKTNIINILLDDLVRHITLSIY